MTSLTDIDFLIERLGGEHEEPLYNERDTNLKSLMFPPKPSPLLWSKTRLPQHLLDCYALCFPEEAAQYSYPGATLHDGHAQLEDDTSESDQEEPSEEYNYVKVARYRRKALRKRRLHYQKKPVVLDYRQSGKYKEGRWAPVRRNEMKDLFEHEQGADEWWRAYNSLIHTLTTKEQPRRIRLHQRPLDKDDLSRIFKPGFSVLTQYTQHALDSTSGALPPETEEHDSVKQEEEDPLEDGGLESDEGKMVDLFDF